MMPSPGGGACRQFSAILPLCGVRGASVSRQGQCPAVLLYGLLLPLLGIRGVGVGQEGLVILVLGSWGDGG
eukprot:CAMPEP_0204416576 /NCGR_PEP_ID=MMETSP0470-20130426/26032_1 /ASSEMBLY_ACC=CAM_ASM_000385 /TAXON_ID=2969 /ORGANISM="Oxyrrhis marina" /LENGTH=70 /DNA_ID=CAMNT_0051413081 /DNA_START=112 /DNA_END=320 /DNA_ORIENTATION=+